MKGVKVNKRLVFIYGVVFLTILSIVIYFSFYHRSLGQKMAHQTTEIDGEPLEFIGGNPILNTNEVLIAPNWLFIFGIVMLIIIITYFLKSNKKT